MLGPGSLRGGKRRDAVIDALRRLRRRGPPRRLTADQSSLWMVKTPVVSARTPPLGALSVTLNVSSGSTAPSPTIGTLIGLVAPVALVKLSELPAGLV